MMIWFLISLVIVGFGQPAFSAELSILTAFVGYALFWKILFNYSSWKKRFILGLTWYSLVQIIQLYWMVSHPYLYIYGVLLASALWMGVQFGILSIFITSSQFRSIFRLMAIAGLWTVFEWSRLFILSGFSWNPSGLALGGHLFSLQSASLVGVYGLTFWVVWVNLLAVKAWIERTQWAPTLLWLGAAALPYLYGYIHIQIHEKDFKHDGAGYNAVLVQTAFPIEETMGFRDRQAMVAFVIQEWKKILTISKKQLGKSIDLLVLPEFAVPFGTYTFVYPHSLAANAFKELYGPEALEKLPPLDYPFAHKVGSTWMVNNAYWAQGLANLFNAEVLVGLEDAEDIPGGEREYYSSGIYFAPHESAPLGRYEKRVLVPMGEYIPLECVKKLAASYGVHGSFTPGKEAKILGKKCPLGVSICYEETFGDLMRENKLKGAEVLVNLTSDIWYPDSLLPKQHLEHARLRTVESGLPLIRACNTGVTCVIDSLGRTVASLTEDNQWLADSLYAKVPTYTYKTLYSYVGDLLIIGWSLLMMLFFLRVK